jgi:small subunit ribosomal protein S16
MAVKMRLRREGKKKQPFYRVVVADVRSPRDGRFIEDIGYYQPLADPSLISIDRERALYWLTNGVQPSDAVRQLLRIEGIWEEFKPGDKGKDRSAKHAQRAQQAAAKAEARAKAEGKAAEAPPEPAQETAERAAEEVAQPDPEPAEESGAAPENEQEAT